MLLNYFIYVCVVAICGAGYFVVVLDKIVNNFIARNERNICAEK